MRWFGRKALVQDARPVLGREAVPPFVTGAESQAGLVPAGYEARARAAYRDNPVAQRAVRLVAEGVGGAPLVAGPLANLVRAPSAGQDLLETAATHLLLHGNAFVQLVGGADGRPVELYALRPERVTPETDARGWPAAYHYRAGESRVRLPAAEVVALRLPDPLDDHRGLGCLGAAAGAVALHNQATRWNLALLANAARPSGALVHEGEGGMPLTDGQVARLREELDALFSGSGNAGRPLLLDGGLRWQALSLSPADMDFEALKAAAARDIALAFGVPPMLLGLPGDSTHANYREANRALWRLTLLPLLGKLLGGLGHALARWWPAERLEVDLDRVPALSEDRERLWRQVSGAEFLSDEEKRAMLGLNVDVGVPSPRSPAGESPLQPGSGVRSAPGTSQIVPGARSAPAPGSNPASGRGS